MDRKHWLNPLRTFVACALFQSHTASAAFTLPLESPPLESTVQSMPGLESLMDGVAKYLSENHIAGAQVSIVKDGQLVLLKGYGIDGIAPEHKVDPSRSLFRIGSISKTFTWIALMQLQERGKLKLTDPINNHLPNSLKIPDEGFTQPIRVLDLMNHTAGFEDALQGLFIDADTQPLSLEDQLQKFRPHRVREPGKFMVYSNYGAALAGALIAHVANMEYESYVEQNILIPLKLTHTTFREEYGANVPKGLPAPMPQNLVADKAKGLEWSDGAWRSFPQEHLVSMAPAGAAVSTAADMARYMMALLDPQQLERAGVLTQSSVAEMRAPSFQSAPGLVAVHHGFFNAAIGHGSALRIDNLAHTGSTLHFLSTMIVIPDLAPPAGFVEPHGVSIASDVSKSNPSGSLGIFISTNSASGRALLDALPEEILTKYFKHAVSEKLLPSKEFAAEAREYAGWYRNMRRSYTKLEKLKSLAETQQVLATADGYLQINVGREPLRFVGVAMDLFHQVDGDASLAFVRDGNAKITNMIVVLGVYQASLERVGFFRTPLWVLAIIATGCIVAIGIVIAALLRLRKTTVQSVWEQRSALLINAVAILWLVFVALFAILIGKFSGAGGEDRFLFSYPQPLLKAALVVVMLMSITTVASTITLIPAWREGNWMRWRRVRHTFAVLVFIALAITLADVNLLGFKYF